MESGFQENQSSQSLHSSSCSFSLEPDPIASRLLATGVNSAVKILYVEPGAASRFTTAGNLLQGHEQKIVDVQFLSSETRSILVSIADDMYMRVWEVSARSSSSAPLVDSGPPACHCLYTLKNPHGEAEFLGLTLGRPEVDLFQNLTFEVFTSADDKSVLVQEVKVPARTFYPTGSATADTAAAGPPPRQNILAKAKALAKTKAKVAPPSVPPAKAKAKAPPGAGPGENSPRPISCRRIAVLEGFSSGPRKVEFVSESKLLVSSDDGVLRFFHLPVAKEVFQLQRARAAPQQSEDSSSNIPAKKSTVAGGNSTSTKLPPIAGAAERDRPRSSSDDQNTAVDPPSRRVGGHHPNAVTACCVVHKRSSGSDGGVRRTPHLASADTQGWLKLHRLGGLDQLLWSVRLFAINRGMTAYVVPEMKHVFFRYGTRYERVVNCQRVGGEGQRVGRIATSCGVQRVPFPREPPSHGFCTHHIRSAPVLQP